MPILKASKKALRGSRRKEARNSLQERQLNEAIRRADDKSVNKAISLIDKAAKNHLIHPNKAARLKSRLAKKIGQTPKSTKVVPTPKAKATIKKAAIKKVLPKK